MCIRHGAKIERCSKEGCTQTLSKREEYVSSMGQRPNYAVAKDARTKLGKEEYASGTERGPNNAAVKDAQTEPSREECTSGTEQRSNDVAVIDIDALIKSYVMECDVC